MREPKQITIYNRLKQNGWRFGWEGIGGAFFLEKNGDWLQVTKTGKILSHNKALEVDGQKPTTPHNSTVIHTGLKDDLILEAKEYINSNLPSKDE